MALHDTKYNHIKVRIDEVANPMYIAMVNEALDKIYSKPVGKSLIDQIIANGQAKFGYKVCIQRPEMKVIEVKGQKMCGAGNLAIRVNETSACDGTGTQTAVKYNHNTIKTPDGCRPNFIGLAHELVHALHNIKGEAKKDTAAEEHRTVGIGKYNNEPICENSIRAEHNVPLRDHYSGLE